MRSAPLPSPEDRRVLRGPGRGGVLYRAVPSYRQFGAVSFVRLGLSLRYERPTRRPKTNFSVGVVGNVVVPSCAEPASLVTAGIAKYWNVIVVWPGRAPGSTSKMEYP